MTHSIACPTHHIHTGPIGFLSVKAVSSIYDSPYIITSADIGSSLYNYIGATGVTGAGFIFGDTSLARPGDLIEISTPDNGMGTPSVNAVDPYYNPSITNTNTGVQTISLQSDMKSIVGGSISFGSGRNTCGRFNTDGSLDTTFIVSFNTSGIIRTSAIQSDGNIIVGGIFTGVPTIPRSSLARLSPTGSLDPTFNPGPTGLGTSITSVRSVAIQADTKIIVGGTYTGIAGSYRSGLSRLNNDGTIDATFNPGPTGYGISTAVNTVVLQPDNKILVGGYFTGIGGIGYSNLVRLNTDGTLDGTFNPPGPTGSISSCCECDGSTNRQ